MNSASIALHYVASLKKVFAAGDAVTTAVGHFSNGAATGRTQKAIKRFG